MSLYHHLKTSQTSPQLEDDAPKEAKTSQTSHARVRQRGNLPSSSFNSDNWDILTPEKGKVSAPRARVTNGTLSGRAQESKIIAWINANPPDLPEHQNDCAACGEYIHVYDTGWVCLGDGALIHYSGKHGKTCFDSWHQTRRDAAKTALNEQKGEINT